MAKKKSKGGNTARARRKRLMSRPDLWDLPGVEANLQALIRAQMTPKQQRPPSPTGVGDLEAQEGAPLTYGWCVYGLREGHSVEDMGKEGQVSLTEMETILREYGLLPPEGGTGWWSAAEARGRAGHHLRRKF